MKRVATLSIIAALAFSLIVQGAFAAPGKGQGKDKPAKKPSKIVHLERINLKAALAPIAELQPATLASGKLTKRSMGKGRGDRSAQAVHMRASMDLPLPSVMPAIADEAAAAAARFVLVLRREGIDYAQCSLALARVENKEGALVAHFKLHLQQFIKKNKLRVKAMKGACDIDLSLADVQSGMPAIMAEDEAVVQQLISESESIEFLKGVLQ